MVTLLQKLGITYYKDKGQYIGEYKDDNKHGKGVLKYPNGDEYDGDWESNEIHGIGIILTTYRSI